MSQKKKLILVTMVTVFLLFVIPFSITFGMHNYYFGERTLDDNNYYEYLSSQNTDLMRDEVSFISNEGQRLKGAFYTQKNNLNEKGLIIWVHGLAVNHENYLPEIEYMTKEGYTVFSYDNTGVNESEGDSLKGLTQSVLDLQKALDYVYELELYNDMPNILIGHSWGGYAVSTVSQLELKRPVDGIVSLAGFWRNINVIEDIGRSRVGDIASLLVPYLVLYEKQLFGDYSSLNGIEGLKASTCHVLMIHSKNDTMVQYKNNFKVYQEIFKDNSRFTFKSYENAGHKLTIEFDSYERIHDILHEIHHFEKDSVEYQELIRERETLLGDYNLEVMNDIVDFCENIKETY